MDKKEMFIKFIEENIKEFPAEIADFWEAFKTGKSVGGMTENGQKILKYMQEHEKEVENLFQAKSIGEGIFMSSRSVSGAMRKLITDGFVSKIAGSPVVYSLTEDGKQKTLDIE